MGLGDPTFGLYLSVLFFREMMVAKAKNGQIEGLSEYFSLLAVATGGFMFLNYCNAKHNIISCDRPIAGWVTRRIK